ncbi:Sec20-domain-containing protein [Serendipita vermifera]|nr:Sec20-domain-containing protein [Serendipita vermifera]
MPPIPKETPFSDSEVVHALDALQQRDAYLTNNSIPHLSALSPASTSLNDQQRLAHELREDLEDFGRRVELLEQLVEDLDTEKERRRGRDIVLQWADRFANLKKEARAALLASKKAIDEHARSRRDELLGSAVYNQEKRPDESTEDALMRTTASLTEALRRTEARLKSELDRSVLSTQLLTSQTATLKQTSNAHGQLTSLLDTSKNLITALEKTDWLDRMLIMAALAVFLLTCAWIIKVRVFDRAARIAFWWVKWMPTWREDSIIEELERGMRSASSTMSEVSSKIAQTLSTTASAFSASITDSVTESATPVESILQAASDSASSLENEIVWTASDSIPTRLLETLMGSEIPEVFTESSASSIASTAKATVTSLLRDEL